LKEEKISARKLKAARTKKKIYEAASRLAAEHGIENVSVDAIVEAAGVSKGSFYVYYESKDALTATVVNDYTNKACADYKSFLETHYGCCSVSDTLIQIAEKISDFIESGIGLNNIRALYKARLSKTTAPASETGFTVCCDSELFKLLGELLKRGIERGELREDISADTMAEHLVLAIRGIVFEWCTGYPAFNLKKRIPDHFKIFLYGITKHGAAT